MAFPLLALLQIPGTAHQLTTQLSAEQVKYGYCHSISDEA